MRWAWNLHPRGVAALMHPLVVAVGQRQERAIWAGLKRYLENGHPPAGRERSR